MLIAPTVATQLDALRVERARQVFLVKGTKNGKAGWVYVLINKAMLPVFQHKVGQRGVDIAQYGEVLYSGWGMEPPEYVVKQLKKEFLQ